MMTNHSERVPTLVAWSLASDRRALADAYYELLTTDLRNHIAKIKAPTLVLVPWDVSQPQDTATTLDTYRKQYAPLAGAQVKLIKGSRHFLMFDQPIATNWAIDEFLGKCSTHAAQ
jgi:pimeloyl-ACP methyl ester carboxylesterase